jgi:predicted nucleic acid-binding Zn ribbon protein
MKKKSNLMSIGDAVNDYLKEFHLGNKMQEADLFSQWKKITNEYVAKHTIKIDLRGEKCYVTFDSAALKHEFSFMKEEVMTNINNYFGRVVVKELWVV